MSPQRVPSVLCLSGHDPTGGAGIHADIEAVGAQGAHALSVITAHTVQDSHNVSRVSAVPPMLLAQQIEALAADCDIAAIKIGLLGDAEQVRVIVEAVDQLRVPVVFDPVLRAGGGANLVGTRLLASVVSELLPLVTLLTPNAAELRRLAPALPTLALCADFVLASGCANVLATGGDEPGERVCNTWFATGATAREYTWPRLPETFHGAGCTLASAIAGQLALGATLEDAIEAGQRWTHTTLERAVAIGRGRRIPYRR